MIAGIMRNNFYEIGWVFACRVDACGLGLFTRHKNQINFLKKLFIMIPDKYCGINIKMLMGFMESVKLMDALRPSACHRSNCNG
jgi:hypothetical protein